jgi:hypothetical protein
MNDMSLSWVPLALLETHGWEAVLGFVWTVGAVRVSRGGGFTGLARCDRFDWKPLLSFFFSGRWRVPRLVIFVGWTSFADAPFFCASPPIPLVCLFLAVDVLWLVSFIASYVFLFYCPFRNLGIAVFVLSKL